MTASFEKTGATTGTLTFSIDQETIKKGLDKAFNKIKKNITVPGFRKGKVTRQMFNRIYGEVALYEEGLNVVLPEAYDAAVKEANVEPVAQPKIDVKSMESGKEWELTAEVTVKPEVKLGEYKNLEVEVDADKKVTAKEVNARLAAAQTRLAELVVKETEAANGDTVVIDFVGSIDGEEFEGGKGNNHSLELGSGQFIPGFEEQLVGHKADDEVEVKVTFPDDYQASELAGKEALFITKIHEVKSKEIPELDDELAKDIDETVESLDELKKKYKAELKKEKEEAYTDALENAAIGKAVENATIDEVPEAMIDEDVHRAMNEFLGGMQQQGISPEMYYQFTGTSEADLHKQYEAEAGDRVRTNLVIEAIAKAENFQVTDEDVEKELADLAAQYNMPIDQVKQFLPGNMVEHDVTMKKAVDIITSTAKVKEKEPKKADSKK